MDMLASCQALLAPIVVLLCGMIVLLLDLRGRATSMGKGLSIYAHLGLLLAAFSSLPSLQTALVAGAKIVPTELTSWRYFGQGMTQDGFGSLLSLLLCLVAALVIGMSGQYLEDKKLPFGEFYALVLFASAGAMLMALSIDLVNLFVGLEVLSVSLYILAGYARKELRSEESAVKYFLLGAFASGFLLYGIALIYGAVGLAVKAVGFTVTVPSYTNLVAIAEALRETAASPTPLAQSPLFLMGLMLVLVGLSFKASLVPFHTYAPDVYQGAPAPVAAFMSAAAKIGAFAALIRLLQPLSEVGDQNFLVRNVLWGIALATMLVGNILAVRQTNLKRMLAYSSVAHAGYLLVGVLAGVVAGKSGTFAADAVGFYLIAYALMNIGAFAVTVWLGHAKESELAEIPQFAGLAKRNPAAAAVMTVLMLSLSGIPLTAGFLGKLYLFYAAAQAQLYWLAGLGLVISVIGLSYYLNLVVQMYFREPVGGESPEVRAGGAKTVAVICAVGTILLGVVPSGLLGPMSATDPLTLAKPTTAQEDKDANESRRAPAGTPGGQPPASGPRPQRPQALPTPPGQ